MANRALIQTGNALLAPQLDYILVDGSSSMSGKWWEFMAGLDAFMGKLQGQNLHSHGIVQVFDSVDLNSVQRDSLIGSWTPFYHDPLGMHGGMTPLYDAINLAGRRLKDLDPPNASVVIVTDGEENSSQHTDEVQCRSILRWMRAKGWQVTFLGCDFDNEAQAKALGMNPRNTIGVRKQKLAEAGEALGTKRIRNAQSGDDIDFTDDERKKFGGFLGGPQ
jgi:hypothetical protein